VTIPLVEKSITPVATMLLGCFAEAIGQVARPPRAVSFRPGGEVQLLLSKLRDECCEGLAWLRVTDSYPSTRFPERDIEFVNCEPIQFAAVVELGAARCAPIGTVATLPSAGQWTETTLDTLADKAAMRRAMCCFKLLDPDRMWLMGSWLPLTAEGGCVGGTQLVTIAVDDVDCWDD
jgi:hypothetical protein